MKRVGLLGATMSVTFRILKQCWDNALVSEHDVGDIINDLPVGCPSQPLVHNFRKYLRLAFMPFMP
tara:strand:- start:182 stop:379 length:198 start_codon:yes stop_codon:yes gene_type:complete